MTHIGQEGRLQAVALLGFVTGTNKSLFQLFPAVDAHRGAQDSRGVAFLVALDDGAVAFFPIGKSCDTGLHLILLMIGGATTCTEVVEGYTHTLTIGSAHHGHDDLDR